MNKRIFITGGTGFFGKALLNHIDKNDLPYDVTVLSRHFSADIKQYFNTLKRTPAIIQDDIRSFKSYDVFDYVIHAATPAVTGLADNEMASIILDGMRNIIDFSKTNCSGKILFTSSGAVYGPYDRPVMESDICSPVTTYGICKLKAEKMLEDSGLDFSIARCFSFSGRFLKTDIHYAIGNFVRQASAGHDIIINGNGSPVRSYLDQEDLCRYLFAILENRMPNNVYNVGSNNQISIKQLAETVKKVINGKIGIHILNQTESDQSRNIYLPNIDRFTRDFKNIISLNNKSLENSILEMIYYMQ